jgi:hypothetical protein
MKKRKTNTKKLQRRAEKLWIHLESHFPDGFDAETLAASIGWSLDTVLETLEFCESVGMVGRSEALSNEATVEQVDPPIATDTVALLRQLTPEQRHRAEIRLCVTQLEREGVIVSGIDIDGEIAYHAPEAGNEAEQAAAAAARREWETAGRPVYGPDDIPLFVDALEEV